MVAFADQRIKGSVTVANSGTIRQYQDAISIYLLTSLSFDGSGIYLIGRRDLCPLLDH